MSRYTQTVRAVELDREPLPQLSLGAWQLKERGIEVAAVRVWHEVRERALEVGRVAQELATHARDWLGRVAERALQALEPAPDAWGEFFAEAARAGCAMTCPAIWTGNGRRRRRPSAAASRSW